MSSLATSSPDGPATIQPARVMIVDNDRDVAAAVGRLLAHRGCDVEAVETGEVALRRLEERLQDGSAVELVLLDLRMPGVGGLEVLDRLDRLGAPPAVIVLSGYIGAEDGQRLRASRHVRAILRKPFDIAELWQAAQGAITGRRTPPATDCLRSFGDAARLP